MFNSKILTISAFAVVIYVIVTSVDIKRNTYVENKSMDLPNTEQRIKNIREKASGKEKIAIEKDNTLQEKVVISIIDYILGEEFRKQFLKHV
jgi:biopolymer transport protein ExbD